MSNTSELIGQVIASQFRIIKKLGSGGMGAVYLAEQMEMGRKVVVKVLHPELTAMNPVVIERFRREARAVAQLNHPNIVQVFVFGQAENGQMYLAMEFIEGRDLGVELAKGPIAQPRALKILDQVCAALIEAHGAGIVHRDLKPENIMLADRHGNPDYVKVLDFGIAKLHDGGGDENAPKLTQAGTVFGTPRYMSPEQVKGETVDARTDIYALGIILYELLCGRHPFEAVTTIDYLMKHVSEPVPVPSVEFGELDIQPRIESILLKCLEKEASARYQSAAELQRDVRLALRDFSEAVRGYPSGSAPVAQTRAAAPRNEKTGKADTPGYYPPGTSAPRKGMPAWVWGVLALVIVGGVVAVVLAIGPKSPTAGPQMAGVDVAGSGGGEGSLFLRDEDKEPGATRGAGAAADDLDDDDDDDDDGGAFATRAGTAGGVDSNGRPTAAGKAPETSVPAGSPIDGFPLPSDATSVTTSPQLEMYETAHAPREILQFYRAKLHGRYALKDVPNGLMVEDQDSPFSYITLQANGDRWYLILQRNALAPASSKPAGPLPPAYGAEFPSDASLIMRSEQAVVARSRLGLAAVCDFYEKKYGGLEGMIVMKDPDAEQPYCTIAASMAKGTDWMAIAIVNDPMSKGAVMISVARRM